MSEQSTVPHAETMLAYLRGEITGDEFDKRTGCPTLKVDDESRVALNGFPSLAKVSNDHILRAVELFHTKTLAAKKLGVARSTVVRRIAAMRLGA